MNGNVMKLVEISIHDHNYICIASCIFFVVHCGCIKTVPVWHLSYPLNRCDRANTIRKVFDYYNIEIVLFKYFSIVCHLITTVSDSYSLLLLSSFFVFFFHSFLPFFSHPSMHKRRHRRWSLLAFSHPIFVQCWMVLLALAGKIICGMYLWQIHRPKNLLKYIE